MSRGKKTSFAVLYSSMTRSINHSNDIIRAYP